MTAQAAAPYRLARAASRQVPQKEYSAVGVSDIQTLTAHTAAAMAAAATAQDACRLKAPARAIGAVALGGVSTIRTTFTRAAEDYRSMSIGPGRGSSCLGTAAPIFS